jgi:Fe-S cluster biogenesis protein NfuA
MANRNEVEQRARTMDALIRRLESEGDPGVRATARELVQALLEFHAAGLTRVLEIVDEAGEAGAPAAALIDRFGEDELVKPLLLLHGLHPLDLHTRVAHALEQTRPFLRTHGGEVQCVSVDESGVVTLRLEAHGCGSSNGTLKTAIEDALREAAPDLTRLVVEHASEASDAVAFVPVADLLRNRVPVARSLE